MEISEICVNKVSKQCRQTHTSLPQLVHPGKRFRANSSKHRGLSGKYGASISTQHTACQQDLIINEMH